MVCSKCGAQVEGNFCPNCGNQINEVAVAAPQASAGAAVFNVVRKNSFYGVAANMLIVVDGGQPTKLSNGSTLTYYLAPGEHTVTYKVWSRRTKEVKVVVSDISKVYALVFKPDWLWGGFKINEKESVLQ